MFTGIITDTTKIVEQHKTADGLELVFSRPKSWSDLVLGESIATNGVCLTVSGMNDNTYSCVLIPETLRVSTFGKNVPKQVNLERALKIGDRLSGHIVQGHVDGIGKVVAIDDNEKYEISIAVDPDSSRFVVYKGSVTVNGVSLTVASVKDNVFTVALVPHTLQLTALGEIKVGDVVNIEFDTIAKYVDRLMNKENT